MQHSHTYLYKFFNHYVGTFNCYNSLIVMPVYLELLLSKENNMYIHHFLFVKNVLYMYGYPPFGVMLTF